MSKKILKRSLALGALMAFVITGSAMAEDFVGTEFPVNISNFKTDVTYDNIYIAAPEGIQAVQSTTGNENVTAYLKANTSIVMKAAEDGNWIHGGICTVYNGHGNNIQVSAPSIYIKDVGGFSGIHIDTSSTIVNVTGFDNFSIYNGGEFKGKDGHGGGNGIRVNKTGSSVSVEGNLGSTIEIDAGQSGVVLNSNGTISLSAGTINIITEGNNSNGSYKGQTIANVGTGTIEILATDKISLSNDNVTENDSLCAVYGTNGTIIIGTKENTEEKATVEVNGNVQAKNGAAIDLKLETKESVLNGAVKDENIVGEGKGTNLLLSGGAVWNNSDTSNVTKLDLNAGIVKQNTEASVVEVGTLTGSGGTFEVENATPKQMVIGTKNDDTQLTVSTKNKDIKAEDLIDVAVFKGERGTAADFVEKTGGPIYSSEKYAVNNGTLGESSKVVDSANLGVNDMAALSLMSWRAETNDMNKRMGELRNANGEHGVWVRMVGGEDEYKSTEYEYTQYQLGYDEKLSTDPSWTVGVALSYTDGDTKFTNGSGEFENKGVSIYGSKLNEDGSFIDLIAKYSRMENDFKTISGMGEGDYGTNAYSVSAEYGKRFDQGKGLWIEPQVELTYGKVSAVDYVAKNNVHVAQDGMESLVGRIGFSLGKNIKQGNVYARASYLYDFDGETKVVLDGVESLDNDLGGGWWEVGVGTNINLSKATYIYADVEKTFGGDVDTNWQWNLGVRYSF